MGRDRLWIDRKALAGGNKLTVGIVGAGDVVNKSHLPVLLVLDETTVAWVTDVDESRAQRVARSYGVNWLPLPKKLETLPYTDIVLLAIPYGARFPYYEALTQRGTALYVEKPLARSAGEHRALCSKLPPSKFSVGFQRRASGATVLLKNLVDKKVFGKLTKIRFRHGGSANVLGDKSFSSNINLAGGGVFFEYGIHGLDLAVYISGATSAHSYRVNTVFEKGFDVHAEGLVTLENSSGEFCLDFKVSWLTETGQELSFIFDSASVHLSIGSSEIQVRSLDGSILLNLGDSDTLYPTKSFQELGAFWRSFVAAIRSETENYTSARSSLLTTEIIENVFKQEIKKSN